LKLPPKFSPPESFFTCSPPQAENFVLFLRALFLPTDLPVIITAKTLSAIQEAQHRQMLDQSPWARKIQQIPE